MTAAKNRLTRYGAMIFVMLAMTIRMTFRKKMPTMTFSCSGV